MTVPVTHDAHARAALEVYRADAEVALEEAEEFVVDSPERFETVGRWVVSIRANLKKVDADAETILKPLREAKQAADKLKRDARTPLVAAIGVLEGKATAYQRQVAAEARAAEEAERKRLEAEAAAARKAAFEEAVEKGDDERAERIADNVDAPVAAPPVAKRVVDERAPKQEGQRTRKVWEVEPEGDDMDAATRSLCAAIGAGKFPTQYVEVLLPKLREFAKSNAGLQPIPGFTQEQVEKVGFTSGK